MGVLSWSVETKIYINMSMEEVKLPTK
jgi:hypothetical protein